MSTLRDKLGLPTDWYVGPRIELKPFNFGLIINRPSPSPYQTDLEFPIYDISDATRLVQVLVTMMNKQFGLTVESLQDGTVKFNTPSPGPYPQKFDVMNHNYTYKKEEEKSEDSDSDNQLDSVLCSIMDRLETVEDSLKTLRELYKSIDDYYENLGEKEQENNTKTIEKEQYPSIIKDLVVKVNKLENELNTIKTKKKYVEWPGQDD